MHLMTPLTVAAVLFGLGVYGVLARRNAVLVLMSLELMLNAANLNLVAFGAWLRDQLLTGQVFALFVVVVAAAEVGIGLAIVLLVFRTARTVDVDGVRRLSEEATASGLEADPEQPAAGPAPAGTGFAQAGPTAAAPAGAAAAGARR